MKRIFATLIFALPLLFCGCSEEEDILPEQRQKIVSYLERKKRKKSPALHAGVLEKIRKTGYPFFR